MKWKRKKRALFLSLSILFHSSVSRCAWLWSEKKKFSRDSQRSISGIGNDCDGDGNGDSQVHTIPTYIYFECVEELKKIRLRCVYAMSSLPTLTHSREPAPFIHPIWITCETYDAVGMRAQLIFIISYWSTRARWQSRNGNCAKARWPPSPLPPPLKNIKKNIWSE